MRTRRKKPKYRHGTGSFGVGRSSVAREALGTAQRIATRRGKVAWGSGTDLECLTRRMNATGGGKHATRALVCAEHGVPNTGRQWRKVRKAGRHARHELRARKRANVQRRVSA